MTTGCVPMTRLKWSSYIQVARGQLGEATFEALAAEGSVMLLEQALDYARKAGKQIPSNPEE